MNEVISTIAINNKHKFYVGVIFGLHFGKLRKHYCLQIRAVTATGGISQDTSGHICQRHFMCYNKEKRLKQL